MMPEGKGIQSNQTFNEQIESNTDFLTTLKTQLPEFFNGNAFDKSKFDAALKATNVDELSDGYRLDFIGKNYAKRQVGQRPTSLIIPDQKHNQKEQNASSKNLFFTGDNLEVLRHLRQNYANSVDFIYIDPPYNTGSDGFVYPDSFNITDEMLTEFGVDLSDDIEVKAFKERYNQQGKKSHSAWLTFMYPRLVLARKLLKDDGVIFVSIDENEYANLKLMMDDIFGEYSYLGDIIRKTRSSANDPRNGFNQQHEYVFIYGKNKAFSKLHGDIKDNSNYTNPDSDPKGAWVITDPSARSGSQNSQFPIINPKNNHIDTPPAGRYWAFSQTTFNKWVEEGKVVFKNDVKEGQRGFFIKKYVSELKSNFNSVNSLFGTNNNFMNQVATKYLRDDVFDGQNYFTSPKPVEFIKKLTQYATEKSSLILDFFAGSATTADAVMQLNKEDGGNRQYIMVQLPEKLAADSVAAKAGFKTIDEISRSRIERAAEKIGDTSGYQHYTVEQVEADTLDQLEKFDPNAILLDDIVTEIPGGVDTLLTTWMTADGYPFGEPVEKKKLGNGSGYYVAGSVLYILENTWDSEATKQLLNELGEHRFNLNTIIVSEYALTFEAMTELKTNIKLLRDKDFDIQVEVRN